MIKSALVAASPDAARPALLSRIFAPNFGRFSAPRKNWLIVGDRREAAADSVWVDRPKVTGHPQRGGDPLRQSSPDPDPQPSDCLRYSEVSLAIF